MDKHMNLEDFSYSLKDNINNSKRISLTRHKTSLFSIDRETNVLTDILKDIHEQNNYEKDCKMPFTFEGKLYLKSTSNNHIFDYDKEDKVLGNWNTVQKKIDFVDYNIK